MIGALLSPTGVLALTFVGAMCADILIRWWLR